MPKPAHEFTSRVAVSRWIAEIEPMDDIATGSQQDLKGLKTPPSSG